ncbi:CaiB/BaiF CoA transferase family protein [Pleionea mediterranea]|uniref:Crotonobetainyl-CoA:carnitine CoA-transferase CaiB-like acyl-CoA transferase n=1 Tax=Pleionea mediterranea TaxID=523701 RepID=A0A316FXR8_9GAMM|nr:CaiB/BaiF CoA-transferase family protein [Pleionea mediterranea]PWK53203.1 crotonobetainyl-CoA:carnitine CoA-transferase CaiB-like acyl-CoA transferase [Pleionea mediterranea]
MSGPLKGIRVLDLSRILAGPWATQMLADYGAEVIKVEHPNGGDDTRRWGPPYLNDHQEQDTEESAYYLSANRGKASIAIDITKPAGQAVIKQLLKDCDVLVENFKVGGLKKYGLDYHSLKNEFPSLIYCSITGFGQTGPMANQPGYDAIIQAMGGLMSITGERDGKPGAGPQKVGVAVSDLMTGLYAVTAITSALYYRTQSGQGQYIDLALLDTQVAWLANQNMNYLVGGEVPQRQGTEHPNIVPYQSFVTQDGHIMVAVGNDAQFQRFCMAVNLSELSDRSEFSTNQQRVVHRDSLIPLIAARLFEQSSEFWLQRLNDVSVPCAPINNIEQVFQNTQVLSRGMLFELPHNSGEKVKQVANPVKFSATPVNYVKAPPTLGEDTRQLLLSMGYSEEEIESLQDKKVIR